MVIPFTPYSPGGNGMELSSNPSQVSVNRPWFSAVRIQSGFLGSVTASVTRYVLGGAPSAGNW
jgi:hypothetical protein